VNERRQCEATTSGGDRCKAIALPGKVRCVFHDPAHAEARAAGRRAGGKRRSQPAAVLPAGTTDAPLATVPEVTAFLGQVANRTARGELDPKVSNATVYALATLLRAIQPDEMARQIEELRRRVEELRGRGHGHGDGNAGGAAEPAARGGSAGDGRNGGAGAGPPEGRPVADLLRDGDGAGPVADEAPPLEL
jgi:hypothetical protein